MTTFLQDEIARVPGESVIPTDTAAILAANPAWTLDGDVWETVATEDVTVLDWGTPAPITPRMGYVLTVDVQTDQPAELRWLIHQTYYDGGTLTLADGAANIDPTTPVPAGAWVATARAWDAPEGIVSGSFVTEITAPIGTTIQLRAPFAAPLDGPLVIRAGAISADKIEGGHFTGETFEGGSFVGGEFRTSDTLPGQVTLSDTANAGTPGLSVEPEDSTGYDVLPSIGPGPTEMHINGGVSTDGSMAGAQFSANGTSIYHNGPGANGAGSWVLANGDEARLAYRQDRTNVNHESGVWVRPGSATLFTEGDDVAGTILASSTSALLDVYSVAGDASSSVRVDLENAMLFTRKQGGRTRRLRVDEAGVWAEIETGPNSWLYDSYNLLETATMPAPELLPYAVSTGWDTDHSPLGSVLVTHSTTGRHCQSRVRFNRRGADFPLTTTNTSIGQVIPVAARHTISMVDYIPVTFPGDVRGELVADYRHGHIYLRTLAGTATMSDADYVYATLSWFIPN